VNNSYLTLTGVWLAVMLGVLQCSLRIGRELGERDTSWLLVAALTVAMSALIVAAHAITVLIDEPLKGRK